MEGRRRTLAAKLDRGESIDLRGDGKAGGGLVLATQAFAAAASAREGIDVEQWPLFSSARRGANVRAFLRVARGKIEAACAVTRPDVAILMNEAAAVDVDFAAGMADGLYVVNTTARPIDVARRYQLTGTVVAIGADALGKVHLGRPLGNVPVLAALVFASGLVDIPSARDSLEKQLHKRRLSADLIRANLALYDAALSEVQWVEHIAQARDQRAEPRCHRFPVGAQSALRTSVTNRTAGYGRPGVRITFADPGERCNGCSLCVLQCPEGIIEYTADERRGAIVHGARFDTYCKACRECIAACPLELFHEEEASVPGAGGLSS
jgi:2-oxoacid:acceptor oxidoreductase gamma subunit (pyruvate/2-ketoisovalerate family)